MKLMFSMSILTMIICSLVAVAFITLLERKILGYMQIRLGPNKVGIAGILQPMSDAVKLYTKEMNWPFFSNSLPFFLSPCLSLMLAMMTWTFMPFFSSVISMKFSMLMFLSILGMGVYPILISGWASNSNYSLLGSMRSLAQTISYEVSLTFILMSIIILTSSLSLTKLIPSQKLTMFLTLTISFFLWMISVVAELSRTPFDFAEGESELVSGFNTEYSSGSFAIIFMAEYMMILFFSTLTTIMFFGFNPLNPMTLTILMLMIFSMMWIRATLPRYRYDKLMNLCWKVVLPISCLNLFMSMTMLILSK